MRRFLLSMTLALAVTPLLARAPADAPATDPVATCREVNPSGGDIRVLTCRLPAGRAHRLAVNFGGGHDDTSASMSATLDGLATECEPGSKLRLFGEDGDVSLHCRIGADATPAAPRTLVVTVLWSHAQYRDFALTAE